MRSIFNFLQSGILLHKFRTHRSKQAKKVALAQFKGDEVTCPICNSHYKIFAPYGVKKRSNARCHNCGSMERHRLLYLYLRSRLDLLNNTGTVIRLLHFAPEKMFHELFSHAPGIAYTPCDLFPEEYNYGGKVPIVKVDITQIPFQDASFDFILCNHVLEHIPDDKKAMAELYRVMASGGKGIFQVPLGRERLVTYEDPTITDPQEREKAFGQKDHVRLYGQDYAERLADAGFNVNADTYLQDFTEAERYRYGLPNAEKIYLCTK